MMLLVLHLEVVHICSASGAAPYAAASGPVASGGGLICYYC